MEVWRTTKVNTLCKGIDWWRLRMLHKHFGSCPHAVCCPPLRFTCCNRISLWNLEFPGPWNTIKNRQNSTLFSWIIYLLNSPLVESLAAFYKTNSNIHTLNQHVFPQLYFRRSISVFCLGPSDAFCESVGVPTIRHSDKFPMPLLAWGIISI